MTSLPSLSRKLTCLCPPSHSQIFWLQSHRKVPGYLSFSSGTLTHINWRNWRSWRSWRSWRNWRNWRNRRGQKLFSLSTPPPLNFSVAKATLQSQMSVCLSVCLSVTETPQPLRIAPIDHRAYWPSSLSTLALLSRLLSLSACFLFHLLILTFLYNVFQDLVTCIIHH